MLAQGLRSLRFKPLTRHPVSHITSCYGDPLNRERNSQQNQQTKYIRTGKSKISFFNLNKNALPATSKPLLGLIKMHIYLYFVTRCGIKVADKVKLEKNICTPEMGSLAEKNNYLKFADILLNMWYKPKSV